MAAGAPTTRHSAAEIATANRTWSINQVQQLANGWLAMRHGALDHWGTSSGEDALLDAIQLERAVDQLPLAERAAIVLVMYGFESDQVETLLGEGVVSGAIISIVDSERGRAASW